MKTHKQKHDKIGIGEKVGVMKTTAGQTRRMKSATTGGACRAHPPVTPIQTAGRGALYP